MYSTQVCNLSLDLQQYVTDTCDSVVQVSLFFFKSFDCVKSKNYKNNLFSQTNEVENNETVTNKQHLVDILSRVFVVILATA